MMTDPLTPADAKRRWPFWFVGMALALVAAVALLAWRHAADQRRQDLQLLQGVRKVCKLSTVEVSLADYARRTLPPKLTLPFDLPLDLPFLEPAEAFLFYAGVISAGFDVCDEPFRIQIDHGTRVVEVALPPPRILSLDIKRFEIINERSTFLNAIEPSDRNAWYQEARESLKVGALQSGVLVKAQEHARELFESFVERWGYHLKLSGQPASAGR